MMKCLLRAPVLGLVLYFLSMHIGFSADDLAALGAVPDAQSTQSPPAAALAAEVSKIAHFGMMSHAKKEKRIASAVRIAVDGATAYKDPAEILSIASDLAVAAATAAPPFKDAIIHAVTFAPAVARIDGASGQIQAAVDYAVAQGTGAKKAPEAAAVEKPVQPAPPPVIASQAEPAATVAAAETAVSAASQVPLPEKNETPEPAEKTPAPANVESPPSAETSENGAEAKKTPAWSIPKIDLGDNAALHLTADLNARYDDNVFVTKDNKVSDEILSAAPGLAFQFGQNSLTNGELSYEENFLHYVHKSAPDAHLAIGSANFGYSDSRLTVNGDGSFQQFYQNQENFFVAGQRLLVRRDELDLGSNAEVNLTEKTSAGVGANYAHTHYRTPGLVDNNSFGMPVNFYYAVWPKVDLSAGYSYRQTKTAVTGSGSRENDNYYNIGARGDFTPKLNGNFSVGYTTSSFTSGGRNSTLAFNGSFGYEVSAKTSGTLAVSRNYSTGAQGEQLISTNLSLGASTLFSPQWQAGATIGYQHVAYPSVRRDDYVDGSVSATYIYSQNITATASYMLRRNASSISNAEFLDNSLSFSADLKY